MSILKLALGRQNAISGTIVHMELDTTGKFGAQYKFTMDSDDLLYLSKDAVERQTARLNLTPDELVGQVVTFWKKPMDNDPTGTKGFLNIELGASGTRVAHVARNDDAVGRDLRAQGIDIKRASTFEEVVDKYAECLGKAHALVDDYNQTLAAPGRELPPEVTTSVAATLLIERHKAGV
jgi:hypothetical protein